MQNTTTISVIIPTYNRRSFLEKAVQSVLEQDEPGIELIIVDDGSTDGTGQLVEELMGQAVTPVQYFYQENKGAAAARNQGIRKAAGEYICFLDSDDRFVPGKISLQKKLLKESGCLVSHTEERWLRRGKHLNQKKKHQPPDGNIFAECLPMCVVGMSTVMARKELFDKYGMFDETLPCCEDYDLWLRVSARERFCLVPQPLTIKNGGRDDQLSSVYRVGMDKYRIRSLVNLLEKKHLAEEQRRSVLRELHRKCEIYGKGCLKYGREDEGNHYFKLASKFTL